MAIIKIFRTGQVTQVQPQVIRIVRVYDHPMPAGILESAFTQKGGVLVGTGDAAYTEFPPGSDGQTIIYDSTQPAGIRAAIPSIAIEDSTNRLINGGFDFAQRTTPGTLTTINDNGYGADRWKSTRENADLQYRRSDASAESGLTSMYYGKYKKITNAGKFMVFQIVEGVNSIPLRGKTVVFQMKMKASAAKTMRMAIIQLQTGGTLDAIPNPFVTSWNTDGTDPTLGANLAIITGAESKSVTTTWQNFSVSVPVDSSAKNIICAIWSNADFSVNDELDIAEAGLFLGSSLLGWAPRLISDELILCQRYYEKSYNIDTAPANGTDGMYTTMAALTTTTAYIHAISYKAQKRQVPSLTFFRGALGSTAGQWAYFDVSWISFTTTPLLTNYDYGFTLAPTTTGLTVYRAYPVTGSWVAESEL